MKTWENRALALLTKSLTPIPLMGTLKGISNAIQIIPSWLFYLVIIGGVILVFRFYEKSS